MRLPRLRTVGHLVFSLGLLTVSFGAFIGGAQAAASLGTSSASNVTIGETLTVSITVNTGGASANSFQGKLSYPANLFEGVRGSYSGSVCTLPVTQPEPSGGSATFVCGTPAGFNGSGTVATVVLKAIASGSATLSLSGCQVLANDGKGTDITGGCSGKSLAVKEPEVASTATPSTDGGGSATPRPTATPRATPTPKPSVSQTPKPAETPQQNATPVPTPEPTPPPVQELPSSTPTPEVVGSTGDDDDTSQSERRTVASAFRDMFQSVKDLQTLKGDFAGLVALLLTMIPVLGLSFATVFFVYRLYLLERRRKRTLDRLFEMELNELAALEGKLDLLAEKGGKGREQYRQEFQQAKENILRQLRPDYNKPVEPPKTA